MSPWAWPAFGRATGEGQIPGTLAGEPCQPVFDAEQDSDLGQNQGGILTLCISFVTLGEFPHLSVPQFPHL